MRALRLLSLLLAPLVSGDALAVHQGTSAPPTPDFSGYVRRNEAPALASVQSV